MIKILLLTAGLLSITHANPVHHPETFLKSIAGKPDEGARIVQHYCANCHSHQPLIPVGAPAKGDTAVWKPRLQQGFNRLIQHTEEGINAMPARGGCFECTDEQLILAILALLPEQDKNDLIFHNKAHK